MGLIILRFKRKLIYFGARLTRGERSFFVAQKSGLVISKGNHFAHYIWEGKIPKEIGKYKMSGAGERLNTPQKTGVFSWCAEVVETLSEGRIFL